MENESNIIQFNNERIEFVVASVIHHVESRSILLLKRSPELTRFAGLWEGSGGRVRTNESLHDAMKREMIEETGIKDAVPILFMQSFWFKDGNRVVNGVRYLFEYYGERDAVKLSPEHVEYKWCDWGELDYFEIIPDLKTCLVTARTLLFFDKGRLGL